MTKIAFISDEHYPFQDEKARNIALQVVHEFSPDEMIVGSDGIDFYSLSYFDKNPETLKQNGLQNVIDAWVSGQKEWTSACPQATKRHIIGNHEVRYTHYLWQNPELCDLDVLKLSSVLNFPVCGIKGEPEEEIVYNDLLSVRHGSVIRKNSGATALAELEKDRYSISTLSGHSHRGGNTLATARGVVYQAQEGFCLCGLEPEYVKHPNWQQGIVLANITDKFVYFEPVPFHREHGVVFARWRGKEFVGK